VTRRDEYRPGRELGALARRHGYQPEEVAQIIHQVS